MKQHCTFVTVILLCITVTHSYSGDLRDTVWSREFPQDLTMDGFNQSGSNLLLSSDSIYIVDAKTGNTLWSHYPWGYDPHYTNNEQSVAYYNGFDSSTHVVNLTTGEIVHKYRFPDVYYYSRRSYTTDGRYMITTMDEKYQSGQSVPPVGFGWKVVDLLTGKVMREVVYPLVPNKYDVDVKKVFLTPNGDSAFVWLGRGYKDDNNQWHYNTKVVLFDVNTGDSLRAYPSPSYGLWFSNDRLFMVGLFDEKKIVIYNTKSGDSVAAIPRNQTVISDVSFSEQNDLFAISGEGTADAFQIWNLKDYSRLYTLWGCASSCFKNKTDEIAIAYSSGINMIKFRKTSNVTNQNTDHQKNILFPNPSNGNIYVTYQLNKSGAVLYQVSTLDGETILSTSVGLQNIGENTITIPTNGIASGTYYLKVITPNGTLSYSFIINK